MKTPNSSGDAMATVKPDKDESWVYRNANRIIKKLPFRDGNKDALAAQIHDLQVALEEKDKTIARQSKSIDDLKAMVEDMAAKNRQLTVEKDVLAKQISDLKDEMKMKIEEARHLEVSAPALLDWIQGVIGYADNKALFRSDEEELSQYRADAKRLFGLLRANGIECDTPPATGPGVFHCRDKRIAEGQEVISAPMLLRNGVIVAEGIVLVSDFNESNQPKTSTGLSPTLPTSTPDDEVQKTARSDFQQSQANIIVPPTPPHASASDEKTSTVATASSGRPSSWDFGI